MLSHIQHSKRSYADVVWDLTYAATKKPAAIAMAEVAIEHYQAAAQRCLENAHFRLVRAFELAKSIDRAEVVAVVRATMFNLLDPSRTHATLNHFLFDFNQSKFKLEPSDEQLHRLIAALERELQEIEGAETPCALTAKMSAVRLAQHYRMVGNTEEEKRVVRTYGSTVLKMAAMTHGMVPMRLLHEAHGVYLQHGLKSEAGPLLLAAREKGKEAEGQMVTHRHEVRIDVEEMNKFLDAITADNLDQTLGRIAHRFMYKRDAIEKEVRESEQTSPFMAMIPMSRLANGQITSETGSTNDDFEGRVMVSLRQSIEFSSFGLGRSIERAKEQYGMTGEVALAVFFRSPLFDPDRTLLYTQALDAYLSGDLIKWIHVILPQIEHILRRLLSGLGGVTNKRRSTSNDVIMVEKNLNELLLDPAIEELLSRDATTQFRVLLCDERGFNVRNNVLHGLVEADYFGRTISDWLFHVLCWFSIFEVKKE